MRNYFRPPESYKGVFPLLWLIGIISVLSPITSYLLWHFFKIAGPQIWLPLSWAGLYHHYYWQLITYPLVHSSDFAFSLSLLLSTSFNLLMIGFTSQEICSRLGTKNFYLFFITLVLTGGLAGGLYFYLTKSIIPLYGLTPILFGCILAWGMLLPTMELQLAFFYKVKIVEIIPTVLLFCLFYLAASAHFSTAVAAIIIVFVTFLYAHFIWNIDNPYVRLPEALKKIQGVLYRKSESDESFMERMLHKIHTQGLHSLSKMERARLEKISIKKSNK